MSVLPILYSFRRCPYAIRARMALAYSQINVEIREVFLKNKPKEMLLTSPKGTVPVLLVDDKILDESLDIMHWALSQNDPEKIDISTPYLEHELIAENDLDFKTHLDHYKYADRFPEHQLSDYRQRAESFLKTLDERLSNQSYLTGKQISIVDIAVFPFVRQFAFVDKGWFDQTSYYHLQKWLERFLISELFSCVMPKLTPWQPSDDIITFPYKKR